MFFHIFIHRIKCVVRDRETIFWTFLFPILLATLFGLAFSNLSKAEDFATVNIAVVNDTGYQKNTDFQSALASVSNMGNPPGEKPLFHVTLLTKDQADESLKNNKIAGYILFEENPRIVVKESGIGQTILKVFMDDFLQIRSAIGKIVAQNPTALQNILAQSLERNSYLTESSPTKAEPNNVVVYYYALIAMACMYGSFFGQKEVTEVQANLSPQGARVNLVPVHKLKIFGYSLLAATLVHLVSILALLSYLYFILKVDFGSRLGYILLACAAGCFVGVSFGALVSALVKKSEGIKVAILIGISMVFSFMSGLMWPDIKYIIAHSAPALAYLNPVNLIADSFYILYYYDTPAGFFSNIGLLFGFTALFYLIVYFVMRRQKYASI